MLGETRAALARQPGAAGAGALLEAQAAVRERGKQLKALASELGMYQAQVRSPGSAFGPWRAASLCIPPPSPACYARMGVDATHAPSSSLQAEEHRREMEAARGEVRELKRRYFDLKARLREAGLA